MLRSSSYDLEILTCNKGFSPHDLETAVQFFSDSGCEIMVN